MSNELRKLLGIIGIVIGGKCIISGCCDLGSMVLKRIELRKICKNVDNLSHMIDMYIDLNKDKLTDEEKEELLFVKKECEDVKKKSEWRLKVFKGI